MSMLDVMSDGTNAAGSLAILDRRLRRLDFVLTGSSHLDWRPDSITKPTKSDDTIDARLSALRASLDRLRRSSGEGGNLIRDIEALCW